MARLQLEAQLYYRMGRYAEAISAYSELFQKHKARAALACAQSAWTSGGINQSMRAAAVWYSHHGLHCPSSMAWA